ncbi:MAG: response regulator [Deltaproteobacteria bacterium]|nr:response regulator [Deltaproteobacteria bacterium]
MSRESILVVDDDDDILELVRYNLTKDNFVVTCAVTGDEAVAKLRVGSFDLIILDIMLPGLDGMEICRLLKNSKETALIPVIMLTAKTEEVDVVLGLELGADDYVTKPFSPRVLLSRIKAVLRRKRSKPQNDESILNTHDLTINPSRHEVRVKGKLVELTASEFSILQFLARRPGWVFTREQIIDSVKGTDYPVTDRSVDVQIVGLRKKLEESEDIIQTVRGVGYRFKE